MLYISGSGLLHPLRSAVRMWNPLFWVMYAAAWNADINIPAAKVQLFATESLSSILNTCKYDGNPHLQPNTHASFGSLANPSGS
ncbi:hypothetical protein ACJ73_10001 [Blastomyces percursus]|uniref:Uncharacterized protein n=1 Tax=Blastomyces percursus TaxID=1658174 RepID=A0A1J9NZF1_9EURO|nr:hypothetical protein ACJ73_10001 [Blastomyces percursus]